jgi:hypothetical protein
MFFFDLYSMRGCLLTLLFSLGLVVLVFAIVYTAKAYPKPRNAAGELDEHAEPGIPLVLKGMYLALAIWIIVVTYLVATMGTKI